MGDDQTKIWKQWLRPQALNAQANCWGNDFNKNEIYPTLKGGEKNMLTNYKSLWTFYKIQPQKPMKILDKGQIKKNWLAWKVLEWGKRMKKIRWPFNKTSQMDPKSHLDVH